MKLNTPLPSAESTIRMYTEGERAKGFAAYVVLYNCEGPRGEHETWTYDIPESLVEKAEAAGIRRTECTSA